MVQPCLALATLCFKHFRCCHSFYLFIIVKCFVIKNWGMLLLKKKFNKLGETTENNEYEISFQWFWLGTDKPILASSKRIYYWVCLAHDNDLLIHPLSIILLHYFYRRFSSISQPRVLCSLHGGFLQVTSYLLHIAFLKLKCCLLTSQAELILKSVFFFFY